MIYVTGDTHGKFQRITDFCEHEKTSCEDIMIILGDAGINYNGWVLDREKKELLKTLPITLFLYSWKPRTETGHDRQLCGKEMGTAALYIGRRTTRIFYLQKMEKYLIWMGNRPL